MAERISPSLQVRRGAVATTRGSWRGHLTTGRKAIFLQVAPFYIILIIIPHMKKSSLRFAAHGKVADPLLADEFDDDECAAGLPLRSDMADARTCPRSVPNPQWKFSLRTLDHSSD